MKGNMRVCSESKYSVFSVSYGHYHCYVIVDSTTEVETDDDRQEVLTTKQLRGPPQKQRMNLLSEHRPHELSTIQVCTL